MACILDLTPETCSQNLFEMCDQDFAARPEPAASRTGHAADDDASTEADADAADDDAADDDGAGAASIFDYASTEADADAADDGADAANIFDYADTEVASSPSEAPAELAARLSSSKPELASSTPGYTGDDSEYNIAAIGTTTGETIAASIRPTGMQAIDPIVIPELEQEGGTDHLNGSCMAGPRQGRSRSPQPRVSHNWVWMPASAQREHAARQGVMRSAAQPPYLPPYAAHALRNLPPHIKKVLPPADPRDMEFAELFAHCLQKIATIRGNAPRQWYIGICATPLWRWGLGHHIDYECMYLLVAGLSSETTRPLEKALIKHFQAQCDRLLQNITPDAVGSLFGRPHFLYVCFASADSCNALIRRRGR